MAIGFKTVPAIVVDMGDRAESKITPAQYDKLRFASAIRIKNSPGYDGVWHQVTNGQVGFPSAPFPSIEERALIFSSFDNVDYTTSSEGSVGLNSYAFITVKPVYSGTTMSHAIIGVTEL